MVAACVLNYENSPTDPDARAAIVVLGQRNHVIDWNIWCNVGKINLLCLKRIKIIILEN